MADSPARRKTIVWLTPEERGGIRTYSEALVPAVQAACESRGWNFEAVYSAPLARKRDIAPIVARIAALQPDVIHIQHEFGLFGSKVPPFYRFPDLVAALRARLPNTALVATAHSVLAPDYHLPWKGRGLAGIARSAFNASLRHWAARAWTQGTWGLLDGVITHSALQQPIVQDSGARMTDVIPHYVPTAFPAHSLTSNPNDVVVFGYFSPEKGQDVVIRAFAQVRGPSPRRLILAGGLRRDEDRHYLENCERLIRELNLSDRVEITGFVKDADIDSVYARAALVVAPFRETSGSGSLAQALARGCAILASDLPLNREINQRVSDCLSLFETENVENCARRIESLLQDPVDIAKLRERSLRYAEMNTPNSIAELHCEYYRVSCVDLYKLNNRAEASLSPKH